MSSSCSLGCFYCNEDINNGEGSYKLASSESETTKHLRYALEHLDMPLKAVEDTDKVCMTCKSKLMSFSRAHKKMTFVKDGLTLPTLIYG